MSRPITAITGWEKKMDKIQVAEACLMMEKGIAVGFAGKLPSEVQDEIRSRFSLTHAEFRKFRRDNGFVWVAPIKKKSISHTELMSLILEWLPMVDIIATPTDASLVKDHNGRHRTHRIKKGWPDISGVFGQSYPNPGRAMFIEVKVDRDEPKPEQIKTANYLETAGAFVIREARSIEEVKEMLEKERLRKPGMNLEQPMNPVLYRYGEKP